MNRDMGTPFIPDFAPAGSRLLIRYLTYRGSDSLYEISIVEWSPTNQAVKYRNMHGHEAWAGENEFCHWRVIEQLPAPSGLVYQPDAATGETRPSGTAEFELFIKAPAGQKTVISAVRQAQRNRELEK
ncbi:MAG: hypothetical protein MOB07_31595 [Acidobacteria bacterium]|nr:hypothetical protein [Acidobacteriota bacterium]